MVGDTLLKRQPRETMMAILNILGELQQIRIYCSYVTTMQYELEIIDRRCIVNLGLIHILDCPGREFC